MTDERKKKQIAEKWYNTHTGGQVGDVDSKWAIPMIENAINEALIEANFISVNNNISGLLPIPTIHTCFTTIESKGRCPICGTINGNDA